MKPNNLKIHLLSAAAIGIACVMISCNSLYNTNVSKLNNLYPKTITIDSEPSGASVILNGQKISETTPFAYVVQPTTIDKIAYRKDKKWHVNIPELEFTFIKDGYITGTETYKPTLAKPLGQRGNYLNYPNGVFHIFTPDNSYKYEKDPTIPEGEANNMVSRDNPGQTDLERTIIRWYFDSEPRGVRLYWRVVSSIPAIVKNTNESYLTTTPYESTRSFNILGLTYENSRDVEIEIKASKNGYEDQVKRYNVRQAIDQQEISGFFEMVSKDYE